MNHRLDWTAVVSAILALPVAGMIAGCSDSSAPLFSVGGSVTGLSSAGLVLRNNGGNDLSVAASGNFTIGAELATGTAYDVTVHAQPLYQLCSVSNGTGTVGGTSVTNVAVTCASPFESHQVVTASATTGAVGTVGTLSVICPGTKKVLNGGYRSASASEVWRVWTSKPVDEGGTVTGDRGWAISFTSVIAGQDVTVHAVCAIPEGTIGYAVATNSVQTADVGSIGVLTVHCPDPTHPLGGGFSSDVPVESWRVQESSRIDGETLRFWWVEYTSVVAGNGVNAHIICSLLPQQLSHQSVSATVTTGAAGTFGTLTAICPVGKRVLGGSNHVAVGGTEVWRVWRSYPVDAGSQVGDRGWSIDFTTVLPARLVLLTVPCGVAPN